MKIESTLKLIALAFLASLPRAFADTTITYQGRLDHGSNKLFTADMTFTLFTTNSGGSPVGGPITNAAIAVSSNGLFTTTMDFGSSLLDHGSDRSWLEIAVRTN